MDTERELLPEERSDLLDEKMVLVASKELAGLKKLNVILWILIVFATLSFTAQFAILSRISSDTKKLSESNNRILSSQITILEKDIKDRDKTIADQQYIINQAIEAITRLARQVKELGGDPGEVRLTPPKQE